MTLRCHYEEYLNIRKSIETDLKSKQITVYLEAGQNVDHIQLIPLDIHFIFTHNDGPTKEQFLKDHPKALRICENIG